MKDYDKIIDMVCMTGKLPLQLIQPLLDEASRQIEASIELCKDSKSDRERLIFGDNASAKADFISAFYDYETEYADNFSMS